MNLLVNHSSLRWFSLVLMISVAVTLIAAVTAIGQVYGLLTGPAMTVYQQGEMVTAAVCPGEPIVYRTRLQIHRPGLIIYTYSIWDRTRERTAVLDAPGRYIIYPEAGLLQRESRVPWEGEMPYLAPGDYELRLARAEWNDGVSILALPFTVRECASE